jgi:hypothetical protein
VKKIVVGALDARAEVQLVLDEVGVRELKPSHLAFFATHAALRALRISAMRS